MAMQQPQQQQQQQRPPRTQPLPGFGKLDTVLSLGQARLSGAGGRGDIPVADYGKYGGAPPSTAASQSQQQQMQPNRFTAFAQPQGPARPQTVHRQQLPLQLSNPKQFVRQGATQTRQASEPWPTAQCTSCGGRFRAELLEEVRGAQILLCKGCVKEQQQPPRPQAAPLDRKKVPPRNPAAAKAGEAAVRRAKVNKKGDSDDAPIDLADDTDDEQEQEQQHESSPDQEQQQQEPAAEQVFGSAAAASTRPRRRSNHMVDLLGEGGLGTATKFAGLQALYPPSGGKGAVSVTADDLERLDPDAFLNDTVIDYYIKVLELSLPAEVRGRFHFFNSFFFKKLTEKSSTTPGQSKKTDDVAKRNHDRVKSWTKGIDIFTKDYLFVPIHDLLHWSLVIICHPGLLEPHAASMGWSLHPEEAAAAAEQLPAEQDAAGAGAAAGNTQPTPCIIHLDSMTSGHQSSSVFRPLQLYLEQEWMRRVNEHKHGKHHKHHQAAAAGSEEGQQQQQQPLKFEKEVRMNYLLAASGCLWAAVVHVPLQCSMLLNCEPSAANSCSFQNRRS
eukprot:GHUV01019338.1.p1 GENE.GHUV01019338.1~~GHUV01019338.1.p1  ORF type:complete len:556 (+),score=211.78 GHUV01019338.1:276-1943(+)